MSAPLVVFGAALRQAAAGRCPVVDVIDGCGELVTALDASMWCGGLIDGDAALLARCAGPTLDVGCGPGRLVAALQRAGVTALGVDISPEAVRQSRRRGASAMRADVFGPLPSEGRWRTLLLADGNIGIGGNPARLLLRCARLLAPDGVVLAEVRPPGEPSWRGDVVLRHAARRSSPFPWATVAADRIATLASDSALRVRHEWTDAGRWFAELGGPR